MNNIKDSVNNVAVHSTPCSFPITTTLGHVKKRKKWIQRLGSPESHFLLLKRGMKLLWQVPKNVST